MSKIEKLPLGNRRRFTLEDEKTAADTVKDLKKVAVIVLILLMTLLLLAACNSDSAQEVVGSAAQSAAAADYCAESGGVVETRYPFYGTNNNNPLQLFGSLDVCTFTAGDDTRITIGLDTLYTDQPTLAALAYRATEPLDTGDAPESANPSSLYCTQLGGTDTFGGVSAAGGGWALEDESDVLSLCIFPDLSVIDSWGITYHSEGTIRGADLADLLRYSG